MRDQVAHHLERARIAARLTIIGTVTEVAPAIEALRRTMEKIHRDRGIAIEVEADAQAKFRGERQDLEEMAGNLVDNACKWAASRVFIEVRAERPGEPGAGPCCGSSSTMTGADFRRPSGHRFRDAASGWTSPSRARGSGCRSWSTSRRSMAAACRSATRRSVGLRAELVLPGV